jgi:hypothetical protein
MAVEDTRQRVDSRDTVRRSITSHLNGVLMLTPISKRVPLVQRSSRLSLLRRPTLRHGFTKHATI